MTSYKDSGVDIDLGDKCSKIAYETAKRTFANRAGKIGEPVVTEGGFSGAMDFGDFYVIQNDDGVGTKVQVARQMKKYDTLGHDLVAMVVDDGICVGAEMVSVSNTIDCDKVDEHIITELMKGLEEAARIAGVVVPGGEIAELGNEVNGFTWNSTAVGIVKKDRFITTEKVAPGDTLVGLRSNMFRSNGMSLVRKILNDTYGPDWHTEEFEGRTWGDIVLTPSKIYCIAVNALTGGFENVASAEVHGIAHITGGGIPGNLVRILKKNNLGANLDQLSPAPAPMRELQRLGNVSDEEAYRTWNMGIGMIIATPEPEKVIEILGQHDVNASVIGTVRTETGINLA